MTEASTCSKGKLFNQSVDGQRIREERGRRDERTKETERERALSWPAQSHQSTDGLPHKDHLMAFAAHCGRPCLFHIQSNLSNQPTHTRWLSLEVDFLIMAIKWDVKNSHTGAAHFSSGDARGSRCLSRCSKDLPALRRAPPLSRTVLTQRTAETNNFIIKSRILGAHADSEANVSARKTT